MMLSVQAGVWDCTAAAAHRVLTLRRVTHAPHFVRFVMPRHGAAPLEPCKALADHQGRFVELSMSNHHHHVTRQPVQRTMPRSRHLKLTVVGFILITLASVAALSASSINKSFCDAHGEFLPVPGISGVDLCGTTGLLGASSEKCLALSFVSTALAEATAIVDEGPDSGEQCYVMQDAAPRRAQVRFLFLIVRVDWAAPARVSAATRACVVAANATARVPCATRQPLSCAAAVSVVLCTLCVQAKPSAPRCRLTCAPCLSCSTRPKCWTARAPRTSSG